MRVLASEDKSKDFYGDGEGFGSGKVGKWSGIYMIGAVYVHFPLNHRELGQVSLIYCR